MARHKKQLPDDTYVDVTIAVETGALCQAKLEAIFKRGQLNGQDLFDLMQAIGHLMTLLAPFRKIADGNESNNSGQVKPE